MMVGLSLILRSFITYVGRDLVSTEKHQGHTGTSMHTHFIVRM